nr:hypothetical protein [Candidatus Sigynarchaeota archaeon]
MLFQTLQDQFFSEAMLVFHVVIIVLSLETSIFFVMQKLMRYQQSPTWMLQVSTTMGAIGIYFIYRVLVDFMFAGNGDIIKTLNQLFIVLIAATSIPSGFFLRSFLKRRGSVSITTGLSISIACSVIFVIFLIELVTNAPLFGGSMFLELLPAACLCVIPLYMLLKLKGKESDRHAWIFTAISIGLISSFILSIFTSLQPDMMNIVVMPVILIGMIASVAIVTGGFIYLPPIDELLWPGDVVALYIINQATGQALLKKSFSEESSMILRSNQGNKASREEKESVLMSGLGGIMNIVNELKISGKKLELIDQGVLKILLLPEENLIFALITKHYVPILKTHLTTFKDNFMLF